MIVKKMFGFLIDDKFVSHEELALEFEKLQAENKKLREALEWYANRNNWKFQSYNSDCKDVIDFNDLGCRSYTVEADFACSSGGRRAREALKEVGEK
jgi:hypothetical protein